ncbi:MAG: serine/threonine-protein kinase [Chlamydiota bacterium]
MTISSNNQLGNVNSTPNDEKITEKEDSSKAFGSSWKHINNKSESGHPLSFSYTEKLYASFLELSYFECLSSNYLVPKEKLIKKFSIGIEVLDPYLKKKRIKYGNVIDQAFIDYKKILDNYVVGKKTIEGNKLVPKTKPENFYSGLTTGLLMKLVRKSVLELFKTRRSIQTGTQFRLSSLPQWHILTEREGEDLQIIKWSGNISLSKCDPRYIGEGAYGVVQKVEDFANGCFTIIKIAFASDEKDRITAENSLLNEIRKLTYIHQKKCIDGIVERPISRYYFRQENVNFIAYTQKIYNLQDVTECIFQNLIDPVTIGKREGLLIAKRLFEGLAFLHKETDEKKAIIHGDIKTENLLVERTSKGKLRVVMGDFGGAKFTKNELVESQLLNPINHPFGTVLSIACFTSGDWRKLALKWDEKNFELWIEYQKKRDVFALTSAVWFLLSGSFPYSINEETYGGLLPRTDLAVQKNDFMNRKYGQYVTNIFLKALAEEPDIRPSNREIIEELLDEIINLHRS